jgi:hypothetical protein
MHRQSRGPESTCVTKDTRMPPEPSVPLPPPLVERDERRGVGCLCVGEGEVLVLPVLARLEAQLVHKGGTWETIAPERRGSEGKFQSGGSFQASKKLDACVRTQIDPP